MGRSPDATCSDLSFVRESCQRSFLDPPQLVPVKGSNFILSTLKDAHTIISPVASSNPSLVSVAQEIVNSIAALDGKYGDRVIYFGPPFHLEKQDATGLAKDSERWLVTILSAYSQSGTVSITEETVQRLMSDDFLDKLDSHTKEDLSDGVSCILHNLPTPAAMILLRAAENAVRKYSFKLTGKTVAKESWSEILNDLANSGRVKKSILGYLQYLKEKRNEAQHPDKRFNQDEAERVFNRVRDLIDELEKSATSP